MFSFSLQPLWNVKTASFTANIVFASFGDRKREKKTTKTTKAALFCLQQFSLGHQFYYLCPHCLFCHCLNTKDWLKTKVATLNNEKSGVNKIVEATCWGNN